MSIYKSLFKQTAIYGIATVLPRMLSFLLVRLYTDYLPADEYGEVSIIFAYLIFFNVVLSYGMETAFFRFYNKEIDKKTVLSTATISLFWSSIGFLALSILFRNNIAHYSQINVDYIVFTIWILTLDALAIIPFSKIRAENRPLKYAVIKILNVVVNLLLNLFFIVYLPQIGSNTNNAFWHTIYVPNFQMGYIFVSNLMASLLTLTMVLPHYFNFKWHFNFALWKQMMHYGLPILIAGLAFAINEHFDKILLSYMGVPLQDIGSYAACYKIGLFMVLFRTAYTLGVEPFFFSHANNKNAPQTYATVTKYFVILGSLTCLVVIVFADVLKLILVNNQSYWSAMHIVPLIVLANFFLGIYTNLSVWYKLIDKTKIGAYISIIGAFATLVLNLLLIPIISYTGSAVATIFAYGIMMFVSYYLGQKKYPIPYDKISIFTYLGLAVILSGVSFYIPIFRETYLFGSIAILFFIYFVYKNERQTILKIIKRKNP
ncbi:MAG TPA: polysaccharide biosynthesis protein [Flavobacterium sp.]|nr:polysaccharide biosynthesis protein [Flavobacterium sp.]